MSKYANLLSNVVSIISAIKEPVFDEIRDALEATLKKFYIEGKIILHDDYALQHTGL